MNPEFERELRQMTRSSTPLTSKIAEYILNSGGKRLRPRLILLIGSSIGLAQKDILPLAYTVELLHTASLLHDDVVDGTIVRRSKPTANQAFGDKSALLAGDFLSSSALEITCQMGKLEVVTTMITTIKKMAEGELKELEHAGHFHDNIDVYLDIIYLKTATLFEFCAQAPGIVAGISGKILDDLITFGRCIGMGFQIVDDIINFAPGKRDTKDAFNDIAEGKSTLPLIFLFQQQPDLLQHISEISKPLQRQKFIIPYMSADILTKSKSVSQSYCDEALKALARTGYLNDDLAQIPAAIMAQLDGRF